MQPSMQGSQPYPYTTCNCATFAHKVDTEQAAALKDYAARCSHLAKLSSIGKSASGTDLWVLELGNRSLDHRPRPGFRYLGNMHGDEPTGRCALCLEGAIACTSGQPWCSFWLLMSTELSQSGSQRGTVRSQGWRVHCDGTARVCRMTTLGVTEARRLWTLPAGAAVLRLCCCMHS